MVGAAVRSERGLVMVELVVVDLYVVENACRVVFNVEIAAKVELDLLWDRLSSGGLLYIDDYCAWGGARKAVDEFFGKRGLQNLVAEAKKKKFCLSIVKP